ncbi:MAG: hypothetical protein D6B27_02015 [Gammaproteobacteria bacterium]|nr:MAG: hypothetical protein D6B27_02015 [Gammaproteobacteria bacterium]
MRYPTTASVKATSKRTTNKKAYIHSKILSKLVLMLSLFLMLTISGCSDSHDDGYNDIYSDGYDELSPRDKEIVDEIRRRKKKKAEEERKAKEPPKHRFVKVEEFKNAPFEDLSNKASYDMPRLQFTKETDPMELERIWSIKIDGTDLRQVVSYDTLYKTYEDQAGLDILSRSPNNRYIVMTFRNKDMRHHNIVIYDLKTKKITRLPTDNVTGYGGYYYNWKPDSSGFFFSLSSSTYFHSLVTGKTKQLPLKYRCHIRLFVDEKLACGGYEKGKYTYAFVDTNGRISSSFKIPTEKNIGFGRYTKLDIDGQYFIYSLEKSDRYGSQYIGTYLYDINQKKNIRNLPDFSGEIILASVKSNILYSYIPPDFYEYKIDSPNNKRKLLLEIEVTKDSSYPSDGSIYNLGGLAK